MKILVADKISPKGVAFLRQQPGFEVVEAYGSSPAKVLELVKDVHAIAVRSETKITAEVFAARPGIVWRLILRPRLRDAWRIISAVPSISRRESRSENMACTTGAPASLFSCITLLAVTVVGIPSSPGSKTREVALSLVECLVCRFAAFTAFAHQPIPDSSPDFNFVRALGTSRSAVFATAVTQGDLFWVRCRTTTTGRVHQVKSALLGPMSKRQSVLETLLRGGPVAAPDLPIKPSRRSVLCRFCSLRPGFDPL